MTIMLTESQLADARLLYDYHAAAADNIVASVILVAGSHDLRVADFAASLCTANTTAVVCSGGAGKVTSGIWQAPESVVFAERMKEAGVPEHLILLETQARNTGENVLLSRRILAASAVSAAAITLVCKPYMARRALATAMKQWDEPDWHIAIPAISFDDYATEDTPLDRMINLMVGDTQRLLVYADRGFQVPVTIPGNVWDAYKRLGSSGFDEFILR